MEVECMLYSIQIFGRPCLTGSTNTSFLPLFPVHVVSVVQGYACHAMLCYVVLAYINSCMYTFCTLHALVTWLSLVCHMTVMTISHECHMTITCVPHDYQLWLSVMSVTWLSVMSATWLSWLSVMPVTWLSSDVFVHLFLCPAGLVADHVFERDFYRFPGHCCCMSCALKVCVCVCVCVSCACVCRLPCMWNTVEWEVLSALLICSYAFI